MADGPVANERWLRIKALFAAALDQPPKTVSAWLEGECGDDTDLRREVESLLASHESDPGFMEAPAIARRGAARVVADRVCPSAQAAMIGRRLGPYRLVAELGRGGMGVVYLAERDDQAFDRQVAIKMVYGAVLHPSLLDRFDAERRILARFEHPNVARLLDAGTDESGAPFAVMEYVAGIPIDRYVRDHRLSIAERLRLFCAVCDAVQYSHERFVVHRDIKPGNVLVTNDGMPKLLDFGIAKLLDPSGARTEQTRTELRALTPESASPEQVRGDPITVASDVYSLGVLLYRLLTDASPYHPSARTDAEITRAICEEEPRRPSLAVCCANGTPPGREVAARRRELAGDLDLITLKALNKEPERRYASVDRLARDIRRHLAGDAVDAVPDSRVYRARKFVARHRVGVGTAAAFVILLVAFAATMAAQAHRVALERDRANREAERANQEAAVARQVADYLTGLFRVSDPAESRGRAVTAREVLDKGAARITSELTRDPVLEARLLFTMGDVYRNLGVLDRAQQMLEQSVEIRRRLLGPDATDTLRSCTLLGFVYDLEGKSDEAEKILTSTVKAARRVLGENHPDALKALMNLAAVYDSQGRYDQYLPMVQDVFDRRRRVLGTDHQDTLASQYNLAVALYRKDRLSDAERLLTDVAASFARVEGADHPHTLMAKDLLATVYMHTKRLGEAARVLQEVYDTRRRVLGPDHMQTLATKLGLANVATMQGRYADAESLYRETLAAQERTEGPDHLDTISTRVSLATMLGDQGRYDQAEAIFRTELARMKRTLGPDHPLTSNCLLGLAGLDAQRGRPDTALAFIRQAMRVDASSRSKLAEDAAMFAPLRGNPEFEALTASSKK